MPKGSDHRCLTAPRYKGTSGPGVGIIMVTVFICFFIYLQYKQLQRDLVINNFLSPAQPSDQVRVNQEQVYSQIAEHLTENEKDKVRIPGEWNVSFQDFTLHVAIDEEIEMMTFEPPSYLSNYRNPCWYERVFDKTPYRLNSIQQSYEGNRAGNIAWKLHLMQTKIAQRSNGTFGWRLRCLPYFYLAGVSKCGTTDLYAALSKHPQILGGLRKEPTYWNRIRYHELQEGMGTLHRYHKYVTSPVPRPFRHYVDLYDPVSERILQNTVHRGKDDQGAIHHMITGDGTPSYLYDFDGWYKMSANKGLSEPRYILADIIYRLTPQARIIIILRNPVDRLFSEYLYFIRNENKTLDDFHEMATKGFSILEECFQTIGQRACIYDHKVNSRVMPLRVRVGLYYLYIKDWLKVFPRDQLYITRLEDYSANRISITNEITQFLGVEPMDPKTLQKMAVVNARTDKGRTLGDMDEDSRALINDFYQPWNKKLAELLGDKRYLWDNT